MRWIDEIRGRVADLDLLPVLSLLPPEGYVPDFLSPPPEAPLVRVDDELERMRTTAPRQIVKELEIFERSHGRRLPAAAEPLRSHPRRELERMVDTLREYWARAVEPYWPRILSLLAADLRYRARRLTAGGPASLFADLHPTVSFKGDWLHVDQPWQGTIELDGRGLLLIPTTFSAQRPSVVSERPWQPTLIYPARGVGLLWEPVAEAAPELGALIGATRARLLGVLGAPHSTTELAALLELTPGGVSQHLSALTAAALVHRRREGRVVLYARTALGDALTQPRRAAAGEARQARP